MTTSDGTGIETFAAVGEGLGIIPDGGERECPSCENAAAVGGKSYLES